VKCELSRNAPLTRQVFVVHRHASLSETGRLPLARCVGEEGWALVSTDMRQPLAHGVMTELSHSCKQRSAGSGE
jgi:hypothetical protein